MTRRPLHRWKSFWLGVLVVAFLGWGWIRSMTHMDGFFWTAGHFAIIAGQGPDGVYIAWLHHRLPQPSTFQWINETAAAGERWFPKAVNRDTDELAIAHWFLILLFLISWTAFLLWRIRRMKRLAAGSAEPPARSST